MNENNSIVISPFRRDDFFLLHLDMHLKFPSYKRGVEISGSQIMWNTNLMQQGNFIDVSLTRHVSGAHVHHQEH